MLLLMFALGVILGCVGTLFACAGAIAYFWIGTIAK